MTFTSDAESNEQIAAEKGASAGGQPHATTDAEPRPAVVAPQMTDAVTQTNVASLGVGPAFAIVQSFLAASQAQGVLYANMVNEHQQLGTAGLAATVQSVIQLLGISEKGGGNN